MTMRRWVVALCILASIVTACKEEAPKPEELASKAALEGYQHLVAGRYEEYLGCVAGTDSLPADYREQLLVNAIQFMAQQKDERGGIDSLRVLRAVADTTLQRVNVFMLLCFGDSTKKEVVIPMVYVAGQWKMK